MDLRAIPPLGILPSVLKAIQMFYITLPDIMIATDEMVLGGAYSPFLIGPTPANLVPGGVPAVQMNAAPNPLPLDVKYTASAYNSHNWAIHWAI